MSGSNFNPPEADKYLIPRRLLRGSSFLEILNVGMSVPLYLTGVVRIFVFSRSKSGGFDLTLNKNKHFSKVSMCRQIRISIYLGQCGDIRR
jgi:hypothetical protein